MQVVIFSSPERAEMLKALKKKLSAFDVFVIDAPITFGKDNFWKRWEQARLYCLASKHDNYLIIPDDVTNLDIKAVKAIHRQYENQLFSCSVINDGRKKGWNNTPNKRNDKKVYGYTLNDLDFFDCGGLTNRNTLSKIKITGVSQRWLATRSSSGVGYQLTTQLREMKAKMFIPTPSLCSHGDHKSVMHPEERKKNPLIAHGKMKVIIGLATFKGREKYLKMALKSLVGQADQIRIYNNEVRDVDLTDNGKFFFLKEYDEPVYYFSCDDDLIYPPTYVRDMIAAIEKYKCIVTHHGRILTGGKGANYYRSHKAFRCLGDVHTDQFIHVAGTGVTAFRTDYFNPTEIWSSPDKKMSDVIFSFEAAKQKKNIMILSHKKGYIQYTNVPNEQTIFGQHVSHCPRQSELADLILNLSPLLSNSGPSNAVKKVYR